MPDRIAGLVTVAERLAGSIEAETRALAAGDLGTLRQSISQKGRLLYELNRAIRECDRAADDPAILEAMRRLREALDANSAMLNANMQAVRELVGIMTSVIRAAEADGTYVRRQP